MQRLRARSAAGSVAAAAIATLAACSSSSTGSGVGTNSGSDSFAIVVGAASYQYQCAPDLGDGGTQGVATPVLYTAACDWPASNPVIEIDIHVLQSLHVINNQTIDLGSAAAPGQVNVTVSLSVSGSAGTSSIYASDVPGPMPTVAPGTTGTVLIKSYDPNIGHLDVQLSNVQLPIAAGFDKYPSSPPTVTIQSAEAVR